MPQSVKVLARNSPLSHAQVEEVLLEMRAFFPDLLLIPQYVETTGDKDQKTSLRDLEKTDFFTKEIDDLLLQGVCRAAIHSAKDLPEPLRKGLVIAALTKGVDPSDSLVLREGETLESLPYGAVIATSSGRREENVRALRKDLSFIDLRGKISERLEKLERREADGVVVAEAALIRLKLTHLNRICLPGETAPMQGRLAVVVRENDREARELFSCIMSCT